MIRALIVLALVWAVGLALLAAAGLLRDADALRVVYLPPFLAFCAWWGWRNMKIGR